VILVHAVDLREGDEKLYHRSSKLWVLGLEAVVLGALGIGATQWSASLAAGWRALVLPLGLASLGLGVWCFVWFLGLEAFTEAARSKHGRRNLALAVYGGVALLAVAELALSYFLSIHE
jgi:hypothetical protein